MRTDYEPAREDSFRPDLVLAIDPVVEYKSSGWNFLINWPGYVIFTPAWNGYVYRADIATQIVVTDREGRSLGTLGVPVSYSLRHAELDRTFYTALGWFALGAGFYNARVFDRDLIDDLHVLVKGNYAAYVMGQLEPRIRTAAESLPTSAALAD